MRDFTKKRTNATGDNFDEQNAFDLDWGSNEHSSPTETVQKDNELAEESPIFIKNTSCLKIIDVDGHGQLFNEVLENS